MFAAQIRHNLQFGLRPEGFMPSKNPDRLPMLAMKGEGAAPTFEHSGRCKANRRGACRKPYKHLDD